MCRQSAAAGDAWAPRSAAALFLEGDGPSVQRLSIVPERADFDRTPNQTATGDVGPDLRFTMSGIRGPRRITLGRDPSGWMLKSVSANGVDVTDVALPFGTEDQSLTDVQVVVTSRITELSGTVVDGRGDITNDYTLLVFPLDRDRWYPGSRYFRRTSPASGGNFSVRGLPPSDYFVATVSGWRVLKDGADAWQDPEFLESIALRAVRATLTAGRMVCHAANQTTTPTPTAKQSADNVRSAFVERTRPASGAPTPLISFSNSPRSSSLI